MNNDFAQQSAKIIQFPARGRFATTGQRDRSETVVNLMSPRVGRIVSGGAWYHDEAIKDSEQGCTN